MSDDNFRVRVVKTSDIIERVYGSGVTVSDIDYLKPGYIAVEGLRPPPIVDGMRTDVADEQRATVNCAIFRVAYIEYPLPEAAPDMDIGDIVRVRHEHLEALDKCERGLCAINAVHVLAVLGTDAESP